MTKQEAIKDLRKHFGLRPGAKVYTNIETVSSSGMSRTISVYVIHRGKTKAGDAILNITSYVAAACGFTVTKDRTIRVGGCGMDMAGHVVYELGRAIYPKGFRCIQRREAEPYPGRGMGRVIVPCPSNDHFNGEANQWHRDGGYALIKCDL